MGYWGCGNFEGDGPRDFLADMVGVRWAAEALRVFDVEGGAGWDGSGERRQIIEETFDRLLRIVERQADGGAPSESEPPEGDLV